MTLMKNEGNLLPIPADKKVALIGPYANAIQLGDYSGTPTYTTTPYQAFAKKMNFTVSDGTVQFENYSAIQHSERSVEKLNATQGCLSNTATGDIFTYADVNLGNGCTKLTVSCGAAKDNAVAIVKFYLDNISSEPIASVTTQNTGGWNGTFKDFSVDVDPSVCKGVHTIIVKLFNRNGGDTYVKAEQEYCGNFDYFRFYKEGIILLEETQGPLYMVTTSAGVNEKATDRE